MFYGPVNICLVFEPRSDYFARDGLLISQFCVSTISLVLFRSKNDTRKLSTLVVVVVFLFFFFEPKQDYFQKDKDVGGSR